MPASWTAERLVRDIGRLAARGLAREAFFEEASDRLRHSVAADGACWHTIDPATLLLTSDVRQSVPDCTTDLVSSEYGGLDDANRYSELATRRRPVGILSQATGGHPERSARYRDMLAPSGVPIELRATFVAKRRAWGSVCLVRQSGRKDFTAADAALLARLSRPMAEGVRSSLLVSAAGREDEPGGPGLVVLDGRGEVELITPAAGPLFEELRPSGVRESEEAPPAAVLAVAAAARAATRHGPRGSVRVPAPARGGGWLTLHASLPAGQDDRVAVIIERSAGSEAAPLRLEAYGLTAREREIAALLVQGLSTADIVARLVLSPHTVQDHLKNIFDKTGVRTRRELVARVFFTDYLPRWQAHEPLGADGAFVADA